MHFHFSIQEKQSHAQRKKVQKKQIEWKRGVDQVEERISVFEPGLLFIP